MEPPIEPIDGYIDDPYAEDAAPIEPKPDPEPYDEYGLEAGMNDEPYGLDPPDDDPYDP